MKKLAPEQLFGDNDTETATAAIAAVGAATNLFEFYDAIGRRHSMYASRR
jgi:hypothetical protein